MKRAMSVVLVAMLALVAACGDAPTGGAAPSGPRTTESDVPPVGGGDPGEEEPGAGIPCVPAGAVLLNPLSAPTALTVTEQGDVVFQITDQHGCNVSPGTARVEYSMAPGGVVRIERNAGKDSWRVTGVSGGTGNAASRKVTISFWILGRSQYPQNFEVTVHNARVEVEPAITSMLVNTQQTLTVRAYDRNNAPMAPDPVLGRTWSLATSDPAVVALSALGDPTIIAKAQGTATVTASLAGGAASSQVTVQDPSVAATVTLSPSAVTLAAGTTQQLTLVAKNYRGEVLSGRPVTWTSSAPSVATVSANGLVQAVSWTPTNRSTITGTVDGVKATAAITVTQNPATVTSVTVSPQAPKLAVGETVQLTALLRNHLGQTVTGRTVTWTSADPSVATVTPDGLVRVVSTAKPSVYIQASVDGAAGLTAVIPIACPTCAYTVTVTPSPVRLYRSSPVQLSVEARNYRGELVTGRPVTWTSSAPWLVVVSPTGLLTTGTFMTPEGLLVAGGDATVTARVDGAIGYTNVSAMSCSGCIPP